MGWRGRALSALGVFCGVLICGCGGYAKPFEPQAVCAVPGGPTWMLQTARDCSFYEKASALLVAELGMPSPARLDWQPPLGEDEARALVAQQTFWVHDAKAFHCQGEGRVVGGCTLWGTHDAEVTRSGGGALHEMLHIWDEARGVPYRKSYDHEGWAAAGWLSQGDVFYWYQDQQFASDFREAGQ